MDKKYEPLFTPFKINHLEIKNRIVMCPMGGTSLFGWMEPNHFDEVAADLFEYISKNDVGLIIPGIAPLKDTIGGRWLYQNKKMFAKLKPFMEKIHESGAKLFIQLTAGFGRSFAITDAMLLLLKNKVIGNIAKPIVDASYLCASPSELPSRWAEEITTRALEISEIKEMVEAFAKTAKLCKEAGVDGVEIHAVHEGYLIDQFTTEYTNKRTDMYGGSFENRYRFAVDIVKAIKEVCGDNYPVSLRYSVVSKTKDFQYGALPKEKYKEIGRDYEESKKAAKYLQDAGYDMLNCDNGTYDAWYWAHPPAYMPKNTNLEDVAWIKKYVDIPVVCAGRMEPEVASKAIKDKKIDAMGVARQFLCDPDWIIKLKEERLEDIRPCLCCHNACFVLAKYKGSANCGGMDNASHMARCALNPMTMQGHKYDIIPAKKIKNIAVIGGGIGGMEVARIAALRGHKVTIYEKSNKLGGVFNAASNFDFKEKDKQFINWCIRQVKKLPIDIKLNYEVKDLTSLNADEVIVATGAKAKRLYIPGISMAIDAIDYLNSNKKVGKNVVIIGGGLSGCEIAYDLHLRGHNPIIVEMQDDLIVSNSVSLANSSYLRDYFRTNNVEVYLNSRVGEIKKGSVRIIDDVGSSKEIKCNDVIVAIGYDPNPLFRKSKHVHLIGDCYKVGNLRNVIWRAWKIAESI